MNLFEPLEPRCLLSASFADSALSGVWPIHGTNINGSLDFDGGGEITGGTANQETGGSGTAAGTDSVKNSGAMLINFTSPSGTGTLSGAIDSSGDAWAVTNNNTDRDLILGVNPGATVFSNASLNGTWWFVINGSNAQHNGQGFITFDGNGNFTQGTFETSMGFVLLSGSYSVTSSGAVTITSNSQGSGTALGNFIGSLNASRSVMLLKPGPGSISAGEELGVAVRSGQGVSHTDSDLAATWAIVGEEESGSITLDGSQDIVSGTLIDAGVTFSLSGSYQLSPNGYVVLSLNETNGGNTTPVNLSGAMDRFDNFIALGGDVGSDVQDNMTILINTGNSSLAAPTGVAVGPPTVGAVALSWNSVAGADSYQVWRSTTDNFSGATRIAAGITGASYSDTTASPGVLYFYWIKPKNPYETGPLGGGVSGYAEMPAPVAQISGHPLHTTLTWGAVTGAASYQIWRSTTDDLSTATKIAAGVTALIYKDATAELGVTYFYWIRAKNAVGVGAFSIALAGGADVNCCLCGGTS